MDDLSLLVGVLVLMLALAWLPGHIAYKRRHPSRLAIDVAGWLSLFFPPLWIIALIWSLAGETAVPAAPLRAFPVTPLDGERLDRQLAEEIDGEGRYKVEGVDRQTGMDTTWYCNAASKANARVKAEIEGIVVTRIVAD